ncbi:membrane protein [Mycobacterium phage Marshawn]|uniref:Membrane protein n=1 Tax=Mycobacterium phage Marshawn TaxID=2652423 RepID=A0A5P8D837_9CAUD|nr:membrane protein [Mycobacterium phage Marshawn]QFP94831.1 membrane protein [Mycobacterium phage Marshawn]
MLLDALLVAVRTVTIVFMLSVLVYRRHTWRIKWERGITLFVAIQAAALFLCGPVSSITVGEVLYQLTGLHDLDNLLGCVAYVLAFGTIAGSMLWRVGADDHDGAALVTRGIIAPAFGVAIPLMVASFLASDAVQFDPALSLPEVHPDAALRVFLCTVYATCALFMLYSLLALRIISQDARQAQVARDWRRAMLCGVLGCAAGVVDTLVPTLEASWVMWVAICALGASCAYIAGRAWRRRMAPYRKLHRAVRTRRRKRRTETVHERRRQPTAYTRGDRRGTTS